MRARAWPLLSPLLGLAACAEPAATLELELWQPTRLDDGSARDFVADTFVELWLIINGAEEKHTFASLESAEIAAVDLPFENNTVEVRLRLTADDGGVALAHSGVLDVSWGAGVVDAPAVLAPPLAAHALVDDAPAVRRGAVCASVDGTVAVVGGEEGGGGIPQPTATSALLSTTAKAAVAGPTLPDPAAGGACAIAPDGTLFALFGCADDGDEPGLFRARPGEPFSLLVHPDGSGCGVDLALDDTGLWLALGDRVQRRQLDGTLRLSVELDEPRFGGKLAVVEDGVLVVGGSTMPGAEVARENLAHIARTGELSELTAPPLHPARVEGLFALTDDGLVRLGASGLGSLVVSAVDLEEDVGAVSRFGPTGLAVLERDGRALKVFSSDGALIKRVMLPDAMPGAHLLSDRGGAVRIVGDGQPVVRVVVPPGE